MKIYKKIEDLLQPEYLDILALTTIIQKLTVLSPEMLLHDARELKTAFNAYLEIALAFDYIEDKEEMKQYIKQEKDSLLSIQKEVSEEDFNEFRDLHELFIRTFWADLKMFKRFDLIASIMQDIGTQAHEQVLADKVFLSAGELLGKSITSTDMSVFTISREDWSMMSITTLFVNEEQKQELLDFYKENNLIEEAVDYEEYLRGKLL